MKKTLIASAVAAATFTSGAAMAQESNLPTVYGNIQLVERYVDSDVSGHNHYGIDDNGSTIGVKHSAEIVPGIEAFGKIELEGIDADNKDTGGDNAGATELDEAYIGIRGDSFGQVWVGSDDSQYEALIGDYSNWIYEVGANNLAADFTTGEGDLIQYVTPSFGGFTFHSAVQVRADSDDVTGNGENEYPYQLAVQYAMDNLTVAVAMDSNDSSADESNENTYGVSATYVIDNLALNAFYSSRKGVDLGDDATSDFGAEGQDLLGVMGTYTLGANSFRASYEYGEEDEGSLESDVITLQAIHNLNDNMYVYVEALQRNNEADYQDDEEINELNVGAVYYF
ncbi:MULTISPECIES: porin [Marinobacter]|uniref:porin n=1 Tax=Marinobacter TaxID=2742 RepID=UPI000DAD7ED5|nr:MULTISPECIES: porin [Marinobacter]